MYQLVFQRDPSPGERRTCEAHLAKQSELYTKFDGVGGNAAERAFTSLAQALLSSNEFLYID